MTELKLSVQAAAQQLLMSVSTVYSWIDKGKLKTEETSTGMVIVISKNELEKLRENNLKSKRNRTAKLAIEENPELQEIPVIDAEFYNNVEHEGPQNTHNITFQLINKVEELARQAGELKRLELIRDEEKKDSRHWQNKFFELQNDYNKLQKEHAVLQEIVRMKDLEIAAFQKQVDELKRPPAKRVSMWPFRVS